MWVAGVDGCPAGWIAVFAHRDGRHPPTMRVVSHIADIVDSPERPHVVAVDMPIGLPERTKGSGRNPEQLIRPLLGARQSSVFAIPSRRAVETAVYRAACAAALRTSDPPRKVSKQGFHLFPKIREIDALLRTRPDLLLRIVEVHPELAFWSMNGERALPEPKKVKGRPYPPGLALRRHLLIRTGLPRDLATTLPPRGAARRTISSMPSRGWPSPSTSLEVGDDPFPTRPTRTLTASPSPSGPSRHRFPCPLHSPPPIFRSPAPISNRPIAASPRIFAARRSGPCPWPSAMPGRSA